MSIDKFGRSLASAQTGSVVGPRGIGFHLTVEGNYDLDGKRLCNLQSPKEPTDAVDLDTVQNKVNLCLRRDQTGSFNAENFCIMNIKEPISNTDAVTKEYLLANIPKKLDKSYSFHQFAIQDVGYAAQGGDAINLNYINDKCVTTKDGITGPAFDAKNLTLTNLADPIFKNEAVNIRYLENHTIHSNLHNKELVFNAKKRRITNVGAAVNLDDVVTKEELSEFGYALFSKLHKGRANMLSKSEWKTHAVSTPWAELFK